MGFTKIALTCVLLAVGQTPTGVVYTNLRSGHMQRDINDPQLLREIRELQLFISQDRGLTWNQIDKIAPDKAGFTYNTPSDGEYWFHVVVVSQQGVQTPSDLYKAAPTMKLIVDTKAPDLKIVSAERQGDELVVAWSVHEDHPDPSQLKLEYRTADSPTWTPMPLTPAPQGKATARLTSANPMVVRMQFKDMANNPVSVEAQVAGAVNATAYKAQAGPQPADFGTLNVSPPPAPLDKTPQPQLPPLPQPALPLPPPNIVTPATPPQPAVSQTIMAPAPQPIAPPVQAGGLAKSPAIASTGDASQGSPVPAAHTTPPRIMPEIHVVNDRDVSVEYEVWKVGPSGVGKVEVWITRDAGANWTRFAEDPEAQQATNGGKYMRTLTLPGEGVFGISLVVKSKAGMGRSGPRPGDAPDMLVEVDTTPPQAQLLPLIPDAQQRDSIILSWSATDAKLGSAPITLEWSERPMGPWQPIAANLANTGRHPWRLPANLPPQVFLRLTVRDQAGNTAVAVTPQPQLVDLSEPEGRLLRVIPANRK